MRCIRAEGLELFYFTAEDNSTEIHNMGLTVPEIGSFMKENLKAIPDVRMVVVPYRPGDNHAEVYYLHWSGSPDLDELDQKVQQGGYTDADFAASILTRYQHTWCAHCGSRWHTLVVPPDTYIGLGDLRDWKMQSRWSDVKVCPSCRVSLRQVVLRIWGANGSSP